MAYPVMPAGFLAGSQGDNDSYRIERSLRFNSADLAYLSRTFIGSGTSTTTATLSLWVKRSKISGSNYADAFYESHAANYNIFGFSGSTLPDTLYFTFRNGGSFYSSNVYRDTSSWYHILINFDSSNATQADRFRFYVNGVRGTWNPSYTPAFALNYNFEGELGVAGGRLIGSFYAASGYEPNFLLAEYHFVDGQALSASSFTETDSTTGRLKAKAYSGTYGNHGFYLKFADNSGTTATTLGKDSSGNGSNWTPNSFSVTAGVGNDSLVDSPTNYGSDTGVGGEVRGNYCVWNRLSNTGLNISNGNLDIIAGGTDDASVRGTIGIASGKWYWEATCLSISGAVRGSVGVATSTQLFGYFSENGNKFNSGGASAYGAIYSTGDVIGVAFDADNGTLTFYRNNTSQGTAFTGLTSGPYFPFVTTAGGGSFAHNFGQRPFAYTAPTGFKALCTTNLPTPTIKKPSSYMDVVTYTGNGSTQTISGLGFSPDLLWIKSRINAYSHEIEDTIRGTGKILSSDSTSAETAFGNVTAFNSNGFSLSSGNTANANSSTYVAWAWDAGSSDVTNNSGSITSTVRANPQNGVSIVGYTGNGTAGATVGHGLGVSPSMVITKKRSTATSSQWTVGFSALGWNKYLLLNSTASAATDSNVWNSAPTSSVFYLGNDIWNNHSGQTTIAYLFAEVEGFSRFGSYTGNGSADGPFVYCGFRPRWVMVKRTDNAFEFWQIQDSGRSVSNPAQNNLFPDSSQVEQIGAADRSYDFVSNGFKLKGNNTGTNGSGGTYIFAAFAEAPFKYARAR